MYTFSHPGQVDSWNRFQSSGPFWLREPHNISFINKWSKLSKKIMPDCYSTTFQVNNYYYCQYDHVTLIYNMICIIELRYETTIGPRAVQAANSVDKLFLQDRVVKPLVRLTYFHLNHHLIFIECSVSKARILSLKRDSSVFKPFMIGKDLVPERFSITSVLQLARSVRYLTATWCNHSISLSAFFTALRFIQHLFTGWIVQAGLFCIFSLSIKKWSDNLLENYSAINLYAHNWRNIIITFTIEKNVGHFVGLLSGSAGCSVIQAETITDLQNVLNDYSPLIFDFFEQESSSEKVLLDCAQQVWSCLAKNRKLPSQLVSNFEK